MTISKTQQKKLDKTQEQANFLWDRAQLTAAIAKERLDQAVLAFKELAGELTEDQINATETQTQEQYKRIEEYLMSEKEKYLERLGIQQD